MWGKHARVMRKQNKFYSSGNRKEKKNILLVSSLVRFCGSKNKWKSFVLFSIYSCYDGFA